MVLGLPHKQEFGKGSTPFPATSNLWEDSMCSMYMCEPFDVIDEPRTSPKVMLGKDSVYGTVAIGTARRYGLKYVWNIRTKSPMTLDQASKEPAPDIRLFDKMDNLLSPMLDVNWWSKRLHDTEQEAAKRFRPTPLSNLTASWK